MIIEILILNLIGLMFWQPQMSSSWKSSGPPIKPTKLERYIANINKLIRQEHYDLVLDLLSRTKYSWEELPVEYWAEEISGRLADTYKQSEQISDLENLANILYS